ncbi:TetR family transcriptional regulator [Streptomyces tubbatahanensis]|uniref:TetR family transcriptional regulator n=1 Tax=Streptomyces tubbatahanensis TaxID=2923272 RepID=A0ABY3XTT4_9ACTN|nr:TetR/AcrR family transcriptional regulator [Streptomyces tubbatahanensis]UNS97901.1 TetR family transcriptional regulator [Streptomyces tubbatahanensis]
MRRTQIIKATIAVVAELGYEGASLARIAEQADVSKGLVSHYFTDKDRLMETVARTTLATLRQTIADSLVLTDPVPEVIRAAIRRVAGLSVTHQAELTAMRQISTNLREADGTLRLGLTEYEETYQGQEALFRRGQEEGSLRDFDTRVMSITYQGAIDTMVTYLHEHPEADAHHYADALADLIVAAIKRC